MESAARYGEIAAVKGARKPVPKGLLMQNRKKRVLPLIITILIMVFIFLRKYIMAGVSRSGIKG